MAPGVLLFTPRSTQLISAAEGQQSLSYDVTSTYVRSDKHLNVTFSLE